MHNESHAPCSNSLITDYTPCFPVAEALPHAFIVLKQLLEDLATSSFRLLEGASVIAKGLTPSSTFAGPSSIFSSSTASTMGRVPIFITAAGMVGRRR